MRLELPAALNEALLAYKRALKRFTGKNVNKDEIILSILNGRVATLKEKTRKMNAAYEIKMKQLAKKP